MKVKPRRRMFGRYIESPPEGISGAHGYVNDFLLALVVFPVIILFDIYCWLTSPKKPEIYPYDVPVIG